jgi:hypothetical protein
MRECGVQLHGANSYTASSIEKIMPTVDEIDRPPAGTACVFCRDDAKHFCPATGYVSETSDDGICDACRCGEPCEVRRRIQALADPFLDMPADPVPEPSRSVPREEWTEADRMKQSTTEIEDLMSRAKGRGIAIPETIRARILAEPVTESNMALEQIVGDPTSSQASVRQNPASLK